MLTNLELMKLRARVADNDRQHNRMVLDKKRSMHRALLYSYQAAWVKKDLDENADYVRALMNPDKVKFDYDEKIISIDWEYNYAPGDTFEWGRGTGSHWIILKPEDTELAYFRANVRRCKYLTAKDPETGEIYSQWASIRGPVETKINTIQKAGIVADVPNRTLDIYMRDTEQNRRTFDRYQNFEFDGLFWKVQAPDGISTPGILEITAEEDYDCKHADKLVAVEDPNPPIATNRNAILGDTFARPLEEKTFAPRLAMTGYKWSITLPAEKNKEVDDVLEYQITGNKITVKWTAMVSGSYILHYGPLEKTIIIESLF